MRPVFGGVRRLHRLARHSPLHTHPTTRTPTASMATASSNGNGSCNVGAAAAAPPESAPAMPSPPKRMRFEPPPTASPGTAASAGGAEGTAPRADGGPGPAAAAEGDPGPVVLPLGPEATQSELDKVVATVVAQLKDGAVVGLPTDTIYGVGCLAQLTAAVRRIYEIKGRASAKPVAICVAEVSHIAAYAEVTVPEALLAELLPGPVTLIFKRTPALNPELNPTTDTIGIRIPDNRLIRAVAAAAGTPLALTSANLSGQRSSVEAGDFREIWHRLAAVVDGGRQGDSRLGSTVVDLSQPPRFTVVRPGDSVARVEACLERHGLTKRDTN
mmetsp:Transcript_26971/g.70863  ORF Transcript_26971/g.70863 Transcript_26971/m.70863 type:complete len:329 (+) Transcript_26971:81-1067(+)